MSIHGVGLFTVAYTRDKHTHLRASVLTSNWH